MKVLYKKNYSPNDYKKFTNIFFSISKFDDTSNVKSCTPLTVKAPPAVVFNSKFKFNPAVYSSNPRNKNNMVKQIATIKNCYKTLLNTASLFNSFYFFKMKKDPIKFRKRKNIFFSLTYSSLPSGGNYIFYKLPEFVLYLTEISYLLQRYYRVKLEFVGCREYTDKLVIQFKNLHLLPAFILNKNFAKVTIYTEIVISFIAFESLIIKEVFIKELIHLLRLFKKS